MDEPQVLVSANFVSSVRAMLIVLAQQGKTPQSQLNQEMEPSRQFCEGYLGIQRARLKNMSPQEIAEVLEVCGLSN